jgi:DNA-binding transcriptional ArsR family regulator
MSVASVFKALADPTRLVMLERLSHNESHTITSLSHGLRLTRQGARKHLQILADSKVVRLRRHGRNTSIVLERSTLEKGLAFIAKLEREWDNRLLALKDFVEAK